MPSYFDLAKAYANVRFKMRTQSISLGEILKAVRPCPKCLVPPQHIRTGPGLDKAYAVEVGWLCGHWLAITFDNIDLQNLPSHKLAGYDQREVAALQLINQRIEQADTRGWQSKNPHPSCSSTMEPIVVKDEDGQVTIPDEMEPRIGWRWFQIDPDGFSHGLLCSLHFAHVWKPGEAAVATCMCRERIGLKQHGGPLHHPDPPARDGKCGIYALASRDDLLNRRIVASRAYPILAELYQWGKIEPGTSGVRSQYAYPKHLWVVVDDAMDGLRGQYSETDYQKLCSIGDPEETWIVAKRGPMMIDGKELESKGLMREDAERVQAELIVNYGVPVDLVSWNEVKGARPVDEMVHATAILAASMRAGAVVPGDLARSLRAPTSPPDVKSHALWSYIQHAGLGNAIDVSRAAFETFKAYDRSMQELQKTVSMAGSNLTEQLAERLKAIGVELPNEPPKFKRRWFKDGAFWRAMMVVEGTMGLVLLTTGEVVGAGVLFASAFAARGLWHRAADPTRLVGQEINRIGYGVSEHPHFGAIGRGDLHRPS